MNPKRWIRKHVVDRLPSRYRLAAERAYLYHYYGDAYVARDARIFRQLCDRNKVALDIGANWGLMTLFLSEYAARVYSFEPVPWICDELRQRFAGSNVSVFNYALGNVEGKLPISIPWIGDRRLETRSSLSKDFQHEEILGEQVSHVDKVYVEVKRLDDLNIENIGFIKIDVEGFEMPVLQGAERTIRENMPHLAVEIEGRHLKDHTMDETFKFLADLGYFGYFAYKGELIEVQRFDCLLMQDIRNEKNNELYVNNFIFSASPKLELKLS